MAEPIRTIRVNHINVVLEDYDATVEHYKSLFDGILVLDLPQQIWHACLIDVGRVIFELFMPHDFFLVTRYGPHWITRCEGPAQVVTRHVVPMAAELYPGSSALAAVDARVDALGDGLGRQPKGCELAPVEGSRERVVGVLDHGTRLQASRIFGLSRTGSSRAAGSASLHCRHDAAASPVAPMATYASSSCR